MAAESAIFSTLKLCHMPTIKMSYYSLGSLVTVKTSFLNEPEGVIAYVYEVYDRPGLTGISLITQNGRDLGGFSLDEQERFLEYYGDTGIQYAFKNVIMLASDWQNGLFKFWADNPEKFKRSKP